MPELYDLAGSVEQANLIDRRSDRRRVLEARLQDFHAAPPGERSTESPEVAAKLQSLGYSRAARRARRRTRRRRSEEPDGARSMDSAGNRGVAARTARRGEAIYQRITQRRPSMAIGYRNLAFLQWQSGDARGAIQTLERAFHADAVEPGMAAQLGSYLAEAGRPADAIALLEPVVRASPADPDALNALGIAYARAGQTDRAATAFPRALADNPANVQALENIGTLEMQRGNPAAQKARSRKRRRSIRGRRARTTASA